MNETEKKLYDYAQSVEWDCDSIKWYIYSDEISIEEYNDLKGDNLLDKTTNFIEKYKPEIQSITLSIEDYNRLRKLEIKSEIKKLKRELKRL